MCLSPRARCRALAMASMMLGVVALGGPRPAGAADAADPRTRALAATCASCHGTDGRPVATELFARLAGQPQEYLLTQLLAFRNGQRPATIMHQITKGYTPAQLEALALYFSQQK